MSRTNRQLPQNMPMPPSMTQQPNAVQNMMSNLDFSEPPDVQIIESSCKLADFKNESNNKWTTVLKEPITIKKGSQIRVASSFTDMRGMDSEIIQFIPEGEQQDNSHTLLTQLYTTNDGTNGKTTSYDYIAHSGFGNQLRCLDRGTGFAVANNIPSQTSGGGTGFEISITSVFGAVIGLVESQVNNITNGGSNYKTGDAVTSNTGGMTGNVICDDLGRVKYVVINNPGQIPPATQVSFSVSGSSGGSGCAISDYTTPAVIGGSPNAYNITAVGQGYAVGDTITFPTPGGGTSSNLVFEVLSVGPNGQLFNKSFFDQGYNYQRTPVYRWAQTFDVTDNLCYARNFKNRSYTAENGQEVSIYNNPPSMEEDVRLSCGDVMQNKEDEFVPGIFHKAGQGNSFELVKSKQQFFSYPFRLSQENGYTVLEAPYQTKTVIDSYGKELTILENPLNQFSNGMAISLTFGMRDGLEIPDTATFNTLQDDLCKYWSGIYTIGFTYNIGAGIDIDGVQYDRYVKMILGANANYDGSVPYRGVLESYAFMGTGSITGYPPNSMQTLEVINVTREDGNAMTGEGGFVNVQIDGAGTSWSSYSTSNGGVGYRVGDQLGLRNADGTMSGIDILVVLVDNIGGIRASAPQGSTLTKASMSGLGQFELRIAQNPWYVIGIGNLENRTTRSQLNYNAVGVLTSEDRINNNTAFTGYQAVYPPVWENLGIENSDDVPLGNELISATAYNGLFKPNGEYPFYDNFDNLNATFSLHSENAFLQITNNKNAKSSTTFQAQIAGADTDFTKFNDGNDQLQFQITKAKWNSIGQNANTLPQTYVKLQYTNGNGTAIEEHIYVNYWYDDGTNYVCNIRCRNIQTMQCGVTYSNIAGWNAKLSARFDADPTIYNVQNNTDISMDWISNDFTFCDLMEVKWGFGTTDTYTGSIGMTATQNFYANQDPNKDVLLTSKDWEGVYNGTSVSTDTLNSYNNGGYYFLTHASQMLADKNLNFKDQTNYLNNAGFAQGMNEWAFSELIENSFSEANNYILRTSDFQTSTSTGCQKVWEYEKFLTQKTFKIPQDFSVPSAIGAWWTKESHKLTGVKDLATGDLILEADQCGLLQNEFIIPVYGSNNQIGTGGEYIPNNAVYPNSGGLEPGHCIGKLGVDENSSYLATEVMSLLPINQVGQTYQYYNVFFRNFFSIIRNYDPLKSNSNNPDRTPLKTINTQARNIGNVNDSNATPPVTGKKTLDGTTLIDIKSTASGAPSAEELYKLYELGSPNPSAADVPAYFGNSSTEYPVRYIENDADNNYGRAKASSYVGCDNMTLAYQTDISAFTFQYFHQPFTSPFVDNSGGDISARIFYGNRRVGVQNHDSFGGNNVSNWCRPQFPRGTFTFQEVIDNITTVDFTNGINPLKAVDPVGLRFFEKLGYIPQDLGIVFRNKKYRLSEEYGNLGLYENIYQKEIQLDDGSNYNFSSITTNFLATNYAETGSSDAILSSIPPPENSAGINSHIQRVTPTHGISNKIVNRWGDYIYYPYSINAQSNSFNSDATQVRYDNATDTYGSVGGLLLSNASRGMGLPNTQGSTTLVNQDTVPVTLNPDCNIYLSYTIQTQSNFITASELPRKLNHGHMVILSNLIQSPNYSLNNQGRLPGISIINKTFIQGDFILSMGMLTFYAKEDRTLTEVTTEIVNNDYSVPSALGNQSTVIYEITNMQPKPEQPPAPIWARQTAAYSVLQQMAQAQAQNPQVNKLIKTISDLRGLGIATLQDPEGDNSNIINQLSQYITHYDIPNMSAVERQQFFATPEGNQFLQQAQNLMSMEGNLQIIDEYAQAGQDMGPLQDIIAEVQAQLGLAHGALPPIPDGAEDLGQVVEEVVEQSKFPMGVNPLEGKQSIPREQFLSFQAPDLSSIRGQAGPPPPETVAGDVEPPKLDPESGIGTSIATSETSGN